MDTIKKHVNRYGDEFTFTLLEDGNIQWSGKFEYCRFGWPNDYTQSLFEYLRDTGKSITLEEYKELVHKYDDEKREYVLKDDKYRKLISSITNKIDMVDPSGGPYLASGMELMGKKIEEFKVNENGYLIITS